MLSLYNGNTISIESEELYLKNPKGEIIKSKPTKSKFDEQIAFIGDKMLEFGNLIEFGVWEGKPILWEFVKQNEDRSLLLLSKDILFRKAFDEDNSNIWSKSLLRKFLNQKFLKNLNTSKILEKEFSILDDEGYYKEKASDFIRLLSEQELVKYFSKEERVKSSWYWWTLSPLVSNSNAVLYVSATGGINYAIANNGTGGVVPALNLKSSTIFKSGKGTERSPYKIRP